MGGRLRAGEVVEAKVEGIAWLGGVGEELGEEDAEEAVEEGLDLAVPGDVADPALVRFVDSDLVAWRPPARLALVAEEEEAELEDAKVGGMFLRVCTCATRERRPPRYVLKVRRRNNTPRSNVHSDGESQEGQQGPRSGYRSRFASEENETKATWHSCCT